MDANMTIAPAVNDHDAAPFVDPIADPVLTAAPGFAIDLARLKMKHYRAWIKAAETQDVGEINGILAGLITRWPYAYDPTDAASYDELTLTEWKDAVQAVTALLQASFQPS